MKTDYLIRFCLLLSGFFLLIPLIANAADGNQPLNLQQLLNTAKKSRSDDQKVNSDREAIFLKQVKKQKSELSKAKKEITKLNKLSKSLETKFSTNEQSIQTKKDQLQQRLGNLKELFGHLTAASGDLRSTLEASIISAQYPGRDQQLNLLINKMNNATLLPEVDEIESLWLEMLREMTESSRVVKFNSEVISPGGETNNQDIVRIGSFNLISSDKYSYSPKSNSVSELSRQLII
jgi:biopolymer transport protein ExbB